MFALQLLHTTPGSPISADMLRCDATYGGATGAASGTPTIERPRLTPPQDGFELIGINLFASIDVVLTSVEL